ncbi:autotransporter outer membrane beta-barrel domain-containing protein [Pseudomonas shirazensis]|uniref:autotransporter outer membrane beta-barrel domain-containing protein n=1 Tax=Pseudomonas shirazensis TaxID=2745494 RepID=UPI003D2A265A
MKALTAPPHARAKKTVYLAMLPLLFSGPVAHAAIVDNGDTLTIDADTPTEGYSVRNGSALIAEGASLRSSNITLGSSLQMTGSAVEGGRSTGLTVNESTANINDSSITSDRLALSVNRTIGGTGGSLVQIGNSLVSGGQIGAQVTGGSRLVMTNTDIIGTEAESVGVQLRGGELQAQGSSISGGSSGIRLLRDPDDLTNSTLTLDGTRVEGREGPALLVDEGAQANILLRNGARLIGADGVLLQVRDASSATARFQVDLQGDVRVDADSRADLTLERSRWDGDFVIDSGGKGALSLQDGSRFSGRLVNADSLEIAGQSSYSMAEDTRLGTLSLNDGTVNMGSGGQFYTLNVDKLSGSGVFAMNVDFASNAHDKLVVTGTATGNHQLLVTDAGKDPTSPEQLTLVSTHAGDANFSLYNGRPVAVGAWAYELSAREDGSGGTEWFLDPATKVISPGTRSVMALFNTAPTVWYGEMTSLRSRMGELRLNGGQTGVWMRTYGNRYNVADGSGTGYQQNQHGVSLGADARLPWGDGQWLAGGLLGYSKSDLDLNEGTSGTIDSYYLGGYTTWLDPESGYYFDGVAKFNRFQNKAKVAINDGSHAKGDYDNLGLGVSAEFGRHLALADGYFVEPFTQWSAVVIQGKDFRLSNDLEADGDRTRSLLGKAGVTGGRTFDLKGGNKLQPYLRAAWAHEFAKGNDVQVNNNRFNNDLSGSRAELGAGVALQMAGGLQVHVDLEYANGEHIEQPYGANIGLRYAF